MSHNPRGGPSVVHRLELVARTPIACVLLSLLLIGCATAAPEQALEEPSVCAPALSASSFDAPIPPRVPPAAVTTGSVPHRQIDPVVDQIAIAELHGRMHSMEGVELNRSGSVVDATNISISQGVDVARPECFISDRAVAHIHPDGSLHAVLPHDRIPAAEAAGWIERHPWSGVRPGYEGYVLVYSPRTTEEVDMVVELVVAVVLLEVARDDRGARAADGVVVVPA